MSQKRFIGSKFYHSSFCFSTFETFDINQHQKIPRKIVNQFIRYQIMSPQKLRNLQTFPAMLFD